MNSRLQPPLRFYYTTAALPCPYLPGQMERRLVTELAGDDDTATHDGLSQAGFRRSHSVAYAPACRECNACVAVRVKTLSFTPSRSQQRILARNRDLIATELPPQATAEQYGLFRQYQATRHRGGEMARMDYFDYQMLVEDTPVDTAMFEFRKPDGTLVAACLTDRMGDGFSAVYSFFDPLDERRSLGTLMILWLIDTARERGLAHVYLGFWIADCRKMAYKVHFQPLEAFTGEGWRLLSASGALNDAAIEGPSLLDPSAPASLRVSLPESA